MPKKSNNHKQAISSKPLGILTRGKKKMPRIKLQDGLGVQDIGQLTP